MKKIMFVLVVLIVIMFTGCMSMGTGLTTVGPNFDKIDDYKETKYASFTIYEWSIGAANTKYWHAEIIRNENVIKTINGRDNIANVPANSSSLWWNIFSININDIYIDGPFIIRFRFDLDEYTYWDFYVEGTNKVTRERVRIKENKNEILF